MATLTDTSFWPAALRPRSTACLAVLAGVAVALPHWTHSRGRTRHPAAESNPRRAPWVTASEALFAATADFAPGPDDPEDLVELCPPRLEPSDALPVTVESSWFVDLARCARAQSETVGESSTIASREGSVAVSPGPTSPPVLARASGPDAPSPSQPGKHPKPRLSSSTFRRSLTHQGLLGLIRDASGLTTLAQRLGAEPPAAQLGEALDGARASLGTADEELPLERGSGSGEAIALGNIGLETSETVEAGRRDARVSAPLPAFSLQGGSQVDRDSLTRFMRGSVKGVQACYERGLKHNAKLAGQLVVHFTVAEDGRVKDLDIDQDSLGSAEVADCIKATIQSQTTPFRPESEVGVSSPFVFSSL